MGTIPSQPDVDTPQGLSESGAAIRDTAVDALARRHAVLLERSKRRELTGAERSELDRLGVVIDTLQGMA
jgi:hypothetical protein